VLHSPCPHPSPRPPFSRPCFLDPPPTQSISSDSFLTAQLSHPTSPHPHPLPPPQELHAAVSAAAAGRADAGGSLGTATAAHLALLEEEFSAELSSLKLVAEALKEMRLREGAAAAAAEGGKGDENRNSGNAATAAGVKQAAVTAASAAVHAAVREQHAKGQQASRGPGRAPLR
jgi:hypothetical protein